MGNIERRLARLEGQQGACNHRSPMILANPTAEEVERRKKELDECPSCKKHGRPKLVIIISSIFDPVH